MNANRDSLGLFAGLFGVGLALMIILSPNIFVRNIDTVLINLNGANFNSYWVIYEINFIIIRHRCLKNRRVIPERAEECGSEILSRVL